MKHILTLIVVSLLFACGSHSSKSSVTTIPEADIVYINGTFWTGEKSAKDASVMAIQDGKIIYVGDTPNKPIQARETVDLKGRYVMPGFIDNHVHLFDGGAGLASVDLRDANTPEEFTKRIADFAKTVPEGRWILIGNWDHELWGGELPHRDWIDTATGNTPVFVMRIDGHMALANSAALKLANISLETELPDGGEIKRDTSGELTGILKDNAMNLVFDVIPKSTDDEMIDVFNLFQEHALSLGLTQVHALIGYPHETDQFDALRMIEQSGAMKIRVHSRTPIEDWENARKYIHVNAESLAIGNSKLKWSGLKGFVDGSLGSTTAWFYEPYLDAPETSGFPLVETEKLKSLMSEIDAAGLSMAIHAIGDKAIDNVIANIQEITNQEMVGDGIVERRYRIEHFQHPSKSAIKAIARNGIIAAMHPYHAIDDGRWAEERIGPERINTTYAFRSILDAGGLLSFGSDWPVAPLSPLEGVFAAVTRRTTDGKNPDGWQPQEKITVEEALTAYTATNAYLGFEEDVAGTLTVGKRADFVILSDDPREVDPNTIPEIKVLATVIDGEVVFEADL